MIRVMVAMVSMLMLSAVNAATVNEWLIVTEDTSKVAVTPYLTIFEDENSAWTLEDIRNPSIKKKPVVADSAVPSFGFTESVFWLTFGVRAETARSLEWLLLFNDALMGQIDVWTVNENGEVIRQVSGAGVPLSLRPMKHRSHVFPIDLASGEKIQVYVRVESGLAIVLPITLHSVSGFLEVSNRETYFYALYFGIIIAMFMYNGFLYLSLRDPNYLWYVLFLASMFFYYGTFNGFTVHLMPWFPPAFIQEFFVLTLLLSGVTALLFTLSFIPLRQERPLLYRLMALNILVSVVGILSVLFVPLMFPALIGTICGMLCAVLSIVAGFLSARSGYEPARYFFAAWFALCVSSVVFGFRTLALLDSNAFTDHIQQVGSAVEMILLSFALAARMRAMKKEKEDMQALAIQNMQRADQLKDEFLANTSHELRTPLNGIIGLAEASLYDTGRTLDSVTRDNFRMIISSGRRLASLVNDILDFSKLRHEDIVLSCRAVDVRSLADVVLTLSRPLVKGRQVRLLNLIPEGLPAVWADENRLQQILHNLVGNAVKFTHEGEVTVSAKRLENDIELSVTDTGIGIPPDRLEQVFDSFNQGDGSIQREYGGTGLGLSITRKLVDLHGGRIEVTSSVGVGSCFSFRLSVAGDDSAVVVTQGSALLREEDPVESQAQAAQPVDSLPLRQVSTRILVVDDEPLNREVLKAQLSSAGFGVVEARDGDEALERLADPLAAFDLVLLDVMMPRRSGLDTCMEIRKDRPALQLPIIFLTARSQPSDILAGFEAGGNDYLVKPFSRDELLARIRIHLELVTTHQMIRNYSRNLEQRVSERTSELLQAQQQLVMKQKMAALGVLTAGVAHEINNPNNFVRGALQNVEAWRSSFAGFIAGLMDDDADDELKTAFTERFNALDKQLGLIEEGSRRIDSIVGGLRIVTRVDESDQWVDVDVVEGLEATVRLLQPTFPPGISISTDFQSRRKIMCFPAEINQVFMNVVLNAMHAIENLGGQGDITGNVGLHSVDVADGLVISISDNGVGMDEETLAKACDPFFTTRSVGQGAGLGLSTSRDIMLRHGGRLELRSAPGMGCEVSLWFPVGPVSDN